MIGPLDNPLTTGMTDEDQSPAPSRQSRPKPGERRVQILQTLALMLQEPGTDRVTTAALAKRLNVSEAALYRHFASKAQMFEGLIDFIENSVFALINQITTQEPDGLRQLRAMLAMLLAFSDKNPGMTRVLVGDALVTEDRRLQSRINQITDRLETSLKQSVRNAITQERLPPNTDPAARASLLLSYVMGRWLIYSKSDFKRHPADSFDQAALLMLASAPASGMSSSSTSADTGPVARSA